MVASAPPDCAAGLGDTGRVTIACTVRNARPVDGKTVFALVDVDMVIEGVELRICGVQARRLPQGGTSVHLPTYKAADGSWRAAVELPNELKAPLTNAVLSFLVEERLARARHQIEMAPG